MTTDELAQVRTLIEEYTPGILESYDIILGADASGTWLRIKARIRHEGVSYPMAYDCPIDTLEILPKSFALEIANQIVKKVHGQIVVHKNRETAP